MRAVLSTLPVLAFALTLAAPAAAQHRPVTVGGGFGGMDHRGLAGASAHVQVGVPLVQVFENAYLRAELSAQASRMEGSPLACRTVAMPWCLGREDRVRQAVASANVVVDPLWEHRGVRSYFVLPGLGVAHRRAETTELEGPAGTCVRGNEFAPCPDAPPFGEYRESARGTGFSVNAGWGLRFRVLGTPLFLESAVHVLDLEGERSLYVPFTLGLAL